MAKLIQCKSCGEQIAKSAKSCPHCGAKNKKPFYKRWWFWLIVLIVAIGALSSSGDDDPETSEKTPGTTQNETNKNQEETEPIVLVAGEAGEYGEMFTMNKGTEFEENYYIYRIPAGTYEATNTGEYMSQINVCSIETKVTEEGWEEPAKINDVVLLDVGKSGTIVVPDGYYIEIQEPSHFTLVKVNDVAEPEPEKTSFTIGESVELNNVVVTLIDVYEINGNGFFEPTDGNTFVICEFEIENNTTGDIAVSSMLSFEAYFDGYAANLDITAITLSEKTQLDATVAAGKKIRGVVGYQAPEDWQNVELQFSPSFWSYKKMIFTSSK